MRGELRRMLEVGLGLLTIGAAFAVGRCTSEPSEPKPTWDDLHSCVRYVDEMIEADNAILRTTEKVQDGWNQCIADYRNDSAELRRLNGEVNLCKYALSDATERAARCRQ